MYHLLKRQTGRFRLRHRNPAATAHSRAERRLADEEPGFGGLRAPLRLQEHAHSRVHREPGGQVSDLGEQVVSSETAVVRGDRPGESERVPGENLRAVRGQVVG